MQCRWRSNSSPPEVYAVIELGDQDAKIIIFKVDTNNCTRRKIPSMNDKCAGGTGAVIDKIAAKLKIPPTDLCEMRYCDMEIHPVAGKCGVFAETDITGLQKQGIPPDQLMASLFDAVVLQNLTVLTRGHTLRPHVLLLGGPNRFLREMREAWQQNIPRTWRERQVPIEKGAAPEELINFRRTHCISPPSARPNSARARPEKSGSTAAGIASNTTSKSGAKKKKPAAEAPA
jgi:activator of 2-hydroxyglutaryl-CoA dehydratase